MKGRLGFNMEENSKSKEIFEWIVCILIALIIVVLIKAFVGFPTVVSGASMDSTLKDKQRLWVSRIGIEIHKYPKRGDIITFEAPSTTYVTKASYNPDDVTAEYKNDSKGIGEKIKSSIDIFGETSFIKRVIGLPGDYVEIKNKSVYLNGQALEEKYLDAGTVTDSAEGFFLDVVVPDGYVYVLGDNREVSGDSRRFGCIPIDKIEGKAVFRFWPLNKLGKVK
jgi:signal peptidase I